MKKHTVIGFAAFTLVFLGAGCESKTYNQTYVTDDATQGVQPVAQIGHVVLLTLKDEADTAELVASSRESLAGIPGLTHYDAGTHLQTGRDGVVADYHVALYIGFDTEADYAAYLVHPDHVAYVEAWQPRFESIVIYDMLSSD